MFFLLQKGGSGDNVLAETFFLIDQQKFFLAFIELLKGVTKPGAEEMVFFLLQGESALLPKKKNTTFLLGGPLHPGNAQSFEEETVPLQANFSA